MTEASALVLFSGGQDSTTCLAWALHRYHGCGTCPACDLRAAGWQRWRHSVTNTATEQERT